MTAIEKPALAISRRSERRVRMAEKPVETPVSTDSSGNGPDNEPFFADFSAGCCPQVTA